MKKILFGLCIMMNCAVTKIEAHSLVCFDNNYFMLNKTTNRETNLTCRYHYFYITRDGTYGYRCFMKFILGRDVFLVPQTDPRVNMYKNALPTTRYYTPGSTAPQRMALLFTNPGKGPDQIDVEALGPYTNKTARELAEAIHTDFAKPYGRNYLEWQDAYNLYFKEVLPNCAAEYIFNV
jgi:hypothetical protein